MSEYKCAVAGCLKEVPEFWLCPRHLEAWQASGERKRATATSLIDFVRRTEQEERP